MISVAIHGAAGRMGCRLIALCAADPEVRLNGAIEHSGHPSLGRDAGTVAGIEPLGLPIQDQLNQAGCDVLIDFAAPAATRVALAHCVETRQAMVIGTTGLTDDDHQTIDQAAGSISVLQAPNMSLGVNLMFALAGQAAKQLGEAYDIEITETHHRFKKDAPSGTALGIASAICQATGKNLNATVVQPTHGADVPRQPGKIPIHALRMGDTVGDHTAAFATLGERLEIRHVATTRDTFVHGAIQAAKWLATQRPGRYHMADVLGLSAR